MPMEKLVQMLSQYVQALAACFVDMQGAPSPLPELLSARPRPCPRPNPASAHETDGHTCA